MITFHVHDQFSHGQSIFTSIFCFSRPYPIFPIQEERLWQLSSSSTKLQFFHTRHRISRWWSSSEWGDAFHAHDRFWHPRVVFFVPSLNFERQIVFFPHSDYFPRLRFSVKPCQFSSSTVGFHIIDSFSRLRSMVILRSWIFLHSPWIFSGIRWIFLSLFENHALDLQLISHIHGGYYPHFGSIFMSTSNSKNMYTLSAWVRDV